MRYLQKYYRLRVHPTSALFFLHLFWALVSGSPASDLLRWSDGVGEGWREEGGKDGVDPALRLLRMLEADKEREMEGGMLRRDWAPGISQWTRNWGGGYLVLTIAFRPKVVS